MWLVKHACRILSRIFLAFFHSSLLGTFHLFILYFSIPYFPLSLFTLHSLIGLFASFHSSLVLSSFWFFHFFNVFSVLFLRVNWLASCSLLRCCFFPSGLTGPGRRSGPRSGTALAHTGGPLPPALSPATTTWAKGPALFGGARVVLPQPGGARGAPTRATRWGVR